MSWAPQRTGALPRAWESRMVWSTATPVDARGAASGEGCASIRFLVAMADKPIRVLFVCHNHPAVRPGGAEGYAFDLYEEMRDSSEFDPIFLARNDRPDPGVSPRH